MRPVYTPAAAARLDREATEPVEVLMERAGLGVALAAVRHGAGYGRRVAVLAGPGNNGGDGYVAARYLQDRGAAVEVFALADPKSAGGRWAAAEAGAAGVPVRALRPPSAVDLIIDGLFGSGFRDRLPADLEPWLDHPAPVVAIDVPSGLDGETGTCAGPAFTAVETVTFGGLKVGHLIGEGPDRTGRVTVVDIGLPQGTPDLWVCEEDDAGRPRRTRRAHKWSAGSVMVVGGSPGISGAALLTAQAALAAGAGAAAIACPARIAERLVDPAVLTYEIGDGDRFVPGDVGPVLERAERFDVLAVGPGLGPGRHEFVQALLAATDKPVVLDADGINAVDHATLEQRTGPLVLTPHAGEFARLAGVPADLWSAAALAEATGTVVLLKGNPTFVMGRERWVVRTGGPELATIGTGDVLTGLLATLWAAGLDGEPSARSAAYWHGVAGRALAGRRTVTAPGLIDELARWMR